MNKLRIAALVASAFAGCGAFISTNTLAQQQVLNLYSSRHYQTDEALYANFEKATGIKVNRIDGPEDPLIERLRSEGDKSPADLLITVDMGRLLKAQQLGLFQPVSSKLLEEKIPAELRAAVALAELAVRATGERNRAFVEILEDARQALARASPKP